MKIDGINLINASSVIDARIENGDNLPVINTDDEGRMFWLKRSYLDYVVGLYVCDGVQWQYTNDNDGLYTRFQASIANMAHAAKLNHVIFADSSSGPFQITLPADPMVGDFVTIVDVAGKFKTNNVTIVRNGTPIRRKTENLKLKVKNATIQLLYSGIVNGWMYSVTK